MTMSPSPTVPFVNGIVGVSARDATFDRVVSATCRAIRQPCGPRFTSGIGRGEPALHLPPQFLALGRAFGRIGPRIGKSSTGVEAEWP
jgi:hypothetical protein